MLGPLPNKWCPRCSTVQPVEHFCIARHTKDGRYYCCRTCTKEITKRNATRQAVTSKLRQLANPEKFKADYAKRNATPEVKAYKLAWQRVNREKVRATNLKVKLEHPEKYKEWQDTYNKKKPEMRRSTTARRRAKKKNATPAWVDKKAMQKFYTYAAHLKIITGRKYEVDHIVPLQSKLVCGLHCEANLQVIDKTANVKKGNRHWPDMP